MAPLDIECGNSDKQPIVVVTPPISSTSTGTQADDNVTEVAVNNNNSGGNVTRSRPPVQIPIGAEASIQSNSRNYNSMIGGKVVCIPRSRLILSNHDQWNLNVSVWIELSQFSYLRLE